MRKKYPLISSASRRSKNTTKLCQCGVLATHRVEIQTSFMRGDDEYEWACESHRNNVEFLTANWSKANEH